jgi:hypothetical protein
MGLPEEETVEPQTPIEEMTISLGVVGGGERSEEGVRRGGGDISGKNGAEMSSPYSLSLETLEL